MSRRQRSITLLLTATIDPGATPFVQRRDPQVRLRDYLSALEAWLSCGAVARVVFCENSGFDLAPVARLAASYGERSVEIISFCGNDAGAVRGKGYSELKLIEHAMRVSSVLAVSDVIAKCTGRLTIGNAVPLFEAIGATDFDVMCPLARNLSVADSRVFAATPAFIREHLLTRIEMIDDRHHVNVEHALACAAAGAVANRMVWRPFPMLPRIVGVSGSTGKSATEQPLKRAARIVYHRLSRAVYER